MTEATATPQPLLADIDDFLAWVEGQRGRYEFVDGRLTMMAGGSETHNDIQINLLTALRQRLRAGPCKPNGSDLLVRIDDRTGRFPAASVTCGREAAITSPRRSRSSRSSHRRPSCSIAPTGAATISGWRASATTS